jgi:polyhydroxyalkanoate synthesis regulator phasin
MENNENNEKGEALVQYRRKKGINARDVLNQIRDKYPMPTSEAVAWARLKEDPEFFDAIIEAVGGGMSVQYFAESVGLSPGKVSIWMNRQEGARAKEYDEARQSRAAMFADRILVITEEVKSGELTPPQGKVIVDNLKWLAETHDRERWGAKIQARVELTTTVEMHLLAVEELAKRVKAGDPRPVIEGEVLVEDNELMLGPALQEDMGPRAVNPEERALSNQELQERINQAEIEELLG